MFVDAETMKFITIRDISEMTLIDTSLDASSTNLTISIRSTPHSITIPARPSPEWRSRDTGEGREHEFPGCDATAYCQ